MVFVTYQRIRAKGKSWYGPSIMRSIGNIFNKFRITVEPDLNSYFNEITRLVKTVETIVVICRSDFLKRSRY